MKGIAPCLLLCQCLGLPLLAQATEPLPELRVTASRLPQPALEQLGNSARVDRDRIALTAAQHVHELGNQLAGTWISRGSGQEHLTAIRSPVLTGPGACGAFLTLEDGIPSRPTGFCNVNQLFELPTELAAAIEVLRGPAGPLLGANGLHGTLNVLLPIPGDAPGLALAAEAGPHDFLRGRLHWDGSAGATGIAAGLLADHDNGFRESSGYRQQKGFLRLARELRQGRLDAAFSASNLDQQTAGFIRGRDAYLDPDRRRENPNPEAFRRADSQRAWLRWTRPGGEARRSEWRLFLRRSDMEFLQHFLPGQPLETNGQISGGLGYTLALNRGPWRLTAGLDAEAASGFLEERQAQSLGPGSNRPPGRHYDYTVDSQAIAPFLRLRRQLGARWALEGGLRLEYLRYDYETRLPPGNRREDGGSCPGGCLFFRPADRSDEFFEAAPELGLLFRIDADSTAWLRGVRGFRPPQATELYRLQSGQSVADLQPETLDSLELGWRRIDGGFTAEAVAFLMRKKHFIFRDADGFNVSDGRSRHRGLELQLRYQHASGLYAAVAATWARHEYAFDRDAARGETIRDGNDIDTAPRTLGSLQAGYRGARGVLEVEWVHLGPYWLDAANTARYPGHDLMNLRAAWRLSRSWQFALRLRNLGDEAYADRADFAFGSYRYLPGRGRELFAEIDWRH